MVSDQATTEPAPDPRPGPDRNSPRLRPLDEIGDDQEVAGIFHRLDDAELEIEPLAIILLLETRREALRREPAGEPLLRLPAKLARFLPLGGFRVGRAAAKRGRIGCTTRGRVRQRSAISTVFSIASGRSLKRLIISARLAK